MSTCVLPTLALVLFPVRMVIGARLRLPFLYMLSVMPSLVRLDLFRLFVGAATRGLEPFFMVGDVRLVHAGFAPKIASVAAASIDTEIG